MEFGIDFHIFLKSFHNHVVSIIGDRDLSWFDFNFELIYNFEEGRIH